MAHTGAARAGVVNLTQTLAQEWGKDGIRVNAIIAGLMHTENAEATYGDAKAQANVGASMPLGRMGTGDDLAGAVLWLCSDLAALAARCGSSMRVVMLPVISRPSSWRGEASIDCPYLSRS